MCGSVLRSAEPVLHRACRLLGAPGGHRTWLAPRCRPMHSSLHVPRGCPVRIRTGSRRGARMRRRPCRAGAGCRAAGVAAADSRAAAAGSRHRPRPRHAPVRLRATSCRSLLALTWRRGSILRRLCSPDTIGQRAAILAPIATLEPRRLIPARSQCYELRGAGILARSLCRSLGESVCLTPATCRASPPGRCQRVVSSGIAWSGSGGRPRGGSLYAGLAGSRGPCGGSLRSDSVPLPQ